MNLILFSLLILTFFSFSSANILHISDIHLDLNYYPNTYSTCLQGDLRCCRNDSIGIYPFYRANSIGNYNCDTSRYLFNKTLEYIRNTENVSLIIYTGDSVNHNIQRNFDEVIDNIYVVHSILKFYFPNISIFTTIGNHDTYFRDQMSSTYHLKLFKELYSIWELKEEYPFLVGGYYNESMEHGNIISLNSIYYDKNNVVGYSDHQKELQLVWLEDVLKDYKSKKLKCYIISHLFPSTHEFEEKYSERLVNIIDKYSDVIEYTFWGHSHNDQLLFFNNTIGFVMSSILPDNLNPSYRIYSKNMRNYKQYVFRLEENKIIKNDIKYELLYQFSDYNIDTLDMLDTFIHNLKTNNTLFKLYYHNYNSGIDKECNEGCKSEVICGIYANKNKRETCLNE
jgi:hypothetical protein